MDFRIKRYTDRWTGKKTTRTLLDATTCHYLETNLNNYQKRIPYFYWIQGTFRAWIHHTSNHGSTCNGRPLSPIHRYVQPEFKSKVCSLDPEHGCLKLIQLLTLSTEMLKSYYCVSGSSKRSEYTMELQEKDLLTLNCLYILLSLYSGFVYKTQKPLDFY